MSHSRLLRVIVACAILSSVLIPVTSALSLTRDVFNDPIFGDPLEYMYTNVYNNPAMAALNRMQQQQQQLQKYGPKPTEIDRAFVDFDKMLKEPLDMDVIEKPNEYDLTVRHPGLQKQDLNIEVHDRVLTITGKHTEEKKSEKVEQKASIEGKKTDKPSDTAANTKKASSPSTPYTYSYVYQTFQRSMTLPDNVDMDKIAAKHDGDVLHIILPKVVTEQSARKQIHIE